MQSNLGTTVLICEMLSAKTKGSRSVSHIKKRMIWQALSSNSTPRFVSQWDASAQKTPV